ncbi:hypothetical protein Holit_00103 [Hollandina sp. SP2]
MKIFACFEGETDIGAIEVLMKKCIPGLNLDINSYTHASLKGVRLAKIFSKTNKALRKQDDQFTRLLAVKKLLFLADKNDGKCIAYHQDAGHDGFRKIYHDTKDAFAAANVPDNIKRLAIVPKEMTESWLLADVKAINALEDGTGHVNQSPNPETLWGNKDDPDSNYPKNYLKRNLEELGIDSNRDTYTKIAEKSDIEVLKRRCPESFGQFYADMQSFITGESAP